MDYLILNIIILFSFSYKNYNYLFITIIDKFTWDKNIHKNNNLINKTDYYN